jgi:hypothetical protein
MTGRHVVNASPQFTRLRNNYRPELSTVRSPTIGHNLDPRRCLATRGCHCRSLMLASHHTAQQIDPLSADQGGRRRRDTTMAARAMQKGDSIDRAIAWAEQELEGLSR